MSNTKLPSGAAYTTIDNFDEMKFLLNDILGGACKEIECDKVGVVASLTRGPRGLGRVPAPPRARVGGSGEAFL